MMSRPLQWHAPDLNLVLDTYIIIYNLLSVFSMCDTREAPKHTDHLYSYIRLNIWNIIYVIIYR